MLDKTFIAIDLGAGSGRVMAAHTDLDTLFLEELHRFENPSTELPGGCYWDVVGLHRNILEGLRRAVEQYGDRIVSIGIDTWGCDYALIDANGELLGMPHQYRDPRFEGMAGIMHDILPEREIYNHTGIRTNFYNTSLHLLAESRKHNPSLAHAANLLFIPDLLAFWLTGRRAVERTVASTSQLLDPRTGEWAWSVIDALGLSESMFGEIVAPGTVLGPLRDEVANFIGRKGIPVVATAGHDTAAAVAGIPMDAGQNLWLSSGTWSIMGIEAKEPITSDAAFEYGFCNELGVNRTVRCLKNIAGLWLIQECKRQWAMDGTDYSFAEMTRMAEAAEPFTAFIDPDDPVFASPGGMPDKITDYCLKTGQKAPVDAGQILRVANESLALKYRFVFQRIKDLTGENYTRLHTGGGGIQNELLSQATADALGIEVVAGPVEATSCGNVIMQMIGTGHLADITAGRELIRRSFAFKTFKPQDTEKWDHAMQRFTALLSSGL